MWLLLLLQTDPFEGLQPGERVEITLRSGHTISGSVARLNGTGAALDVSESFPDVVGTMKVRRADAMTVRRLAPMSAEARAAAETARERSRESLEEENRRRRAREADFREEERRIDEERSRLEAERAEVEARERAREAAELDRRVRAREIYDLFPEFAGWGERAYREIDARLNAGGLPPTRPELDFHRNYELWTLGRDLYARSDVRPRYFLDPCVGFVRPVPWRMEFRYNQWTIVP
jgi:hypothetical protein